MNTNLKIEEILKTVEELREAAGDGARSRKLLDALFRLVHNLKAQASANGLNDLAAAAHEFENVLHSLRTGNSPVNNTIPADIWNELKADQKQTLQQAIAEGASILVLQPSFDVADFDQRFRSLKETLTKNGEVISASPRADNANPGKVIFQILYAERAETTSRQTKPDFLTPAFEEAFVKLSAELSKLPSIEFDDVFQQAVRAGRSAAVATGKEVDFEVRADELEQTLDAIIVAPLIHLVRNAVDHGIEASDERVKLGKNPRGKIVIEAVNRDGQTRITVSDDGRGIAPESVQKIFHPGFSTANAVSEISGRGVGLDAVKTEIEQAGGTVTVSSHAGHGSTFEITIPDRR
jgi:two-component system chemotaxis sensor kinase CheA